MAELSRCCHAPVVVAGERSTHWYACTRCRQPADPVHMHETCTTPENPHHNRAVFRLIGKPA